MKYKLFIIGVVSTFVFTSMLMGCISSYKLPIDERGVEGAREKKSKKYGYIVVNFNLNAISIGDEPNLTMQYTYRNTFRLFVLNAYKHIFKINQFDSILYPIPKVTPSKPKVYKVKAGKYVFNKLVYKNNFSDVKSKYIINKRDNLKYVYIFKGFPKEFIVKPDEVLYLGDILFIIDEKNINTRITDNFEEDMSVISETYDFSNKTINTVFKNDDGL